jgi:hypothetical protein
MRQILLETAETDTRVKLKLEGGQTVNGKPVNFQESRPLMAESDEENPPWGGAHIRFSLTADEIPTEHEVEQNPNHYAIVEIEENLSTEEWFCPQINWWAEKKRCPERRRSHPRM